MLASGRAFISTGIGGATSVVANCGLGAVLRTSGIVVGHIVGVAMAQCLTFSAAALGAGLGGSTGCVAPLVLALQHGLITATHRALAIFIDVLTGGGNFFLLD